MHEAEQRLHRLLHQRVRHAAPSAVSTNTSGHHGIAPDVRYGRGVSGRVRRRTITAAPVSGVEEEEREDDVGVELLVGAGEGERHRPGALGQRGRPAGVR